MPNTTQVRGVREKNKLGRGLVEEPFKVFVDDVLEVRIGIVIGGDLGREKDVSHRNRILAGLSKADVNRLAGAQRVELRVNEVLERPGAPITHIYFVETGLVSIVAIAPPAHRIEVGMIGYEGMTGTGAILGDGKSSNELLVQSTGVALKISTAALRTAMNESPSLFRRLQLYNAVLMTQASQTALANGRGLLNQRLARWMLMWHDRLQQDSLVISHTFLSTLLGVRRAGVTTAIHMLEGKSLIRSSRTLITILDRKGLEKIAGGFYGLTEAEYARVIGPLSG